MIYKLISDYLNANGQVAEGRLSSRNYFIPYSTRKVADKTIKYNERYSSDRVRVLSGEWDFKYYGNALGPVQINTDEIDFQKITVPHSWQSEGVEEFEYWNNLPFKMKENVPIGNKSNNTSGVYRKTFEICDTTKNYVLSFIKVMGAYDLYVNGIRVGFSKLSNADFEITNRLVVGTNEVVVVLHKWSDASLVDTSANFAEIGIVGDVLLYMHDYSGVLNYNISTKKEGNNYLGQINILLANVCDNLIFTIEDDGKVLVQKSIKPQDKMVNIEFDSVFEDYSSEVPRLYDMYITTANDNGIVLECVKSSIGFKSCSVATGTFLYNNQPIKINGINYSCIYNKEGKLLSAKDYYKDLQTIKKHNLNAVQFLVEVDPIVYQMCDELGLYIIKRTKVCLDFARNNKAIKMLNKKSKFINLIKAIVFGDYIKAAQNTAFIMYNFANENTYSCAREAIEYIENMEGLVVYDDFNSKIQSISNPSVSAALDEANNEENQIIFFSKFASNNGIGCATLTEFSDLINSVPRCMGGCIDEFCDRYILGKGYDDCGMLTVGRKSYSGADNIKYVYRPFIAKLISNDKIEIINNLYFKDSRDLSIFLVVIKNGKQLSRTQLNAVIKPRSSKIFDITLGHIDGDMYLDVIAINNKTNEHFSYEQLPISYQMTDFDFGVGEKLTHKEYNGDLFINFDGGEVVFSKEVGTIISYKVMGKEILKPNAKRVGGNCFNTNIYRPFIRNMDYSPDYVAEVQSFNYKEIINENGVIEAMEIQSEVVFKLKKKDAFLIQDMFKVNSNGVVEVFSVITPLTRHLPNLDCFGKQLRLQNAYGNVTYYGRGPLDNYIDMFSYAPMGLYKSSVDTVCEDYAIAQESGNHTNVHFVTLTDNNNNGIMVIAKKNPFQLRVKPYVDKEIMRCFKERTNNYNQTGIYVDINAFVSGIGKTEDGLPISKYLVRPSEYVIQFALVPLYKENAYDTICQW
ncbi:MAG: sugar-binding domain-containing protein [Clostridia bacterium]